MNSQIPSIIEIEDGEKFKSFSGSFERPKLETEIQTMPYMGLITHMVIRTNWSSVKLQLFNCSTEDLKWLNRWGYGTKKNLFFNVVDPTGLVIEKWTIIGAIVSSLEIQLFDFDNYIYRNIVFNKLTRKVLIEKNYNPTFQIGTKLEVQIDMANYEK